MFGRALFLVDRNALGEQAGNAFNETKIRSLRLVVVDECHRGYLLDRELSDDELEFRSYEDYISKHRRVLEHFDAVRIGLTATPARILPRVRAAFSSPPTPTGSRSGPTRAREAAFRFRRFTRDWIRDKKQDSLDIAWLRDESLEDADSLPEPGRGELVSPALARHHSPHEFVE
ncbi:MAG TPA: DEAD/DEAH box helicase family protein [Rectinemataceae bacterium]|nr:DEAD/DEAH box helicase family protein [Rectinemataceae bacterium]